MSFPPRVGPLDSPARQKSKSAPYDERNDADYQELSTRIATALETIAHDESIPATEQSLAQLANCSRGTLRNRVWPLQRLKLIKEDRVSKPKTSIPQTPAEIERFDRRKLQNDLALSRTEAAKWFDAYQNERSETRKARRAIKLLTEEIAALNKQVAKLQERKSSSSRSSSNVAPFPGRK